MSKMKKIIVVIVVLALMLLTVAQVAFGQEPDIELSSQSPAFSVGVGYIAIPNGSGILLEGTVEFTEQFHGFFGLTPFNDGFFIRAGGVDYKFLNESNPELRPGLGAIFVVGEGFSPTASLSIVSVPEEVGEPRINITARGGVNVISGSIGIRF